MEQIEKKYDLSHRDVLKEETKNEITELDNSIRQLKEDIYNLIISNIPHEKLDGEVEVPYIVTQNCDYQRLKNYKTNLNLYLRNIEEKLSFKNLLTQQEIFELQKEKVQIKSDLDTLQENPKRFLRMEDARCCNYSQVEDELVKTIIKYKIKRLSLLKKAREEIGIKYKDKFKNKSNTKPKQKVKKPEKSEKK